MDFDQLVPPWSASLALNAFNVSLIQNVADRLHEDRLEGVLLFYLMWLLLFPRQPTACARTPLWHTRITLFCGWMIVPFALSIIHGVAWMVATKILGTWVRYLLYTGSLVESVRYTVCDVLVLLPPLYALYVTRSDQWGVRETYWLVSAVYPTGRHLIRYLVRWLLVTDDALELTVRVDMPL